MIKKNKQSKYQENLLYNKILSLSRNKLFYTKYNLRDTFQNRIILIFLHISFLFIKSKQSKYDQVFTDFCQNVFDLTFKKIEINMREIGHGDVTVNKNMKHLVKVFYKILMNCENFNKNTLNSKNLFLNEHLEVNKNKNGFINIDLVKYFEKYQAFCFDLRVDSVLKGNLNFNLK